MVEFIRKSFVLSFYNLVGIAFVCFPKPFNDVNPSPEVAREDAAAAAAAKGKEKAPLPLLLPSGKTTGKFSQDSAQKKGGERKNELMLLTFLWVVCRHSGSGAVIDKSVCDRLWCWSCAKKGGPCFPPPFLLPPKGPQPEQFVVRCTQRKKRRGRNTDWGTKTTAKLSCYCDRLSTQRTTPVTW